MKHLALTIGVILAIVGTGSKAIAASTGTTMFDLFYASVQDTSPYAKPSDRLARYVIEEMKSWRERGIIITADDIDDALAGVVAHENNGLCDGKLDIAGRPYTLDATACLELQNDILGLLWAEQEIEQLGANLTTLAHTAELAIADEPKRPVDMALYSLLLRRVWSGTGAAVIPWNPDGDEPFAELNLHLEALSSEDLDKAILRFHHGYFRDAREADPRFSGVLDFIGTDLKNIADKIGITGNPRAVGVFSTPALRTKNVALWARKDDIGLMWIYPTHTFRLSLREANAYPQFFENGENLAYPFAYEGNDPPSGAGIASPACSRMMGREGYLCRPRPPAEENCQNPGDGSSITLVKCSERLAPTQSGPSMCTDFSALFTDTGVPLEDPQDPGHLNPALTKADYTKMCSPEQRVLYQSDITSNACYVSLCVLQSMNGHTLIPQRSPVVTNEATSPYLACIRPDPQLGLYTEIAEDSPYPLPEYLGQFLVRDFERQYCTKNGDAPQPLLGLCGYNDNEDAALATVDPQVHTTRTATLAAELRKRGNDFHSIAASIGQRASLDQTLELQRKMFARLAHVIQHVADLFLELRKAPLTQSACPWTGPFPSAPVQ